jgi:hypothetical protein
MRWVPDTTGRFAQRPHYEAAEIDAECEALICGFLHDRHGGVGYPVTTDDLIVLLEREAADIDIYADLTAEGPDVEGATYFSAGRKPTVKIAKRLADDPWKVNRFRTTATHELGHVRFHTFLWPLEPRPTLFYADETHPEADASPRCKRQNIQSLRAVDWMEWQAGYACGAFLMPLTAMKRVVGTEHQSDGRQPSPRDGSTESEKIIKAVSTAFQVSAEAARIRLIQLRLLTDSATQRESLPL